MSSSPDVLNAGRVGRPHGLDGSFHVTRPRAPLLVLGGAVRVGATWREIVRRSGTDDRPILRVDGVDDRPAVEALRGEELFVARTAAPPLEPGEYWAEDLQGCRVVSLDGRSLGEVRELRALPSCEVLEVGELLVPLVGDAVRDVDVEARRIVVDTDFLGLVEGDFPGSADGDVPVDGDLLGSADGDGGADDAPAAVSATAPRRMLPSDPPRG